MPTEPRPLVVTLLLDEPTQSRFERERAALFPPGRTEVGAHVTLFHALPAHLRDELRVALAEVGPLVVEVTEVRSLGRGVAYALSCPPLQQHHRSWQRRWPEHLTRQDAQPLRLHVTVQNKVEAVVARRTLAELRSGFVPWSARAAALRTWRYDGGPWTLLDEVRLD